MDIVQGYFGLVASLGKESVMEFLLRHKIIHAAVILVVFFALSKMFRWLMSIAIHHFTKRTKTRLDDLIIERTQRCASFLVFLLGVYLALVPLEIPENINSVINNVILSLAVVLLGVIGVRILDSFIDVWGSEWAQKTRSTIDDALLPLFHKTSKVVFFIVCLSIILKVWDFNIAGLLAGVGIAGMILGLALKDSFANIFGGISIVMDKNIKVGDKIKLHTGEVGIVRDIGLRSTKLRTFDNDTLTIPNGVLAQSIITNYAPSDNKKREVINFSVVYGADVEKVEKVVLKALEGIEGAVYDPKPIVVFKDMGESGLNFSAIIWSTWQGSTALKEVRGVKIEATKRIYEALNKAKIGIPFPTRTVYMHQVKNK